MRFFLNITQSQNIDVDKVKKINFRYTISKYNSQPLYYQMYDFNVGLFAY